MARHRELGLTDHEYDLIVEKLGREPNQVELAVFSLMWSEHCGYKHSRRLLKTLPVEGGKLILGPGENAGAVDGRRRAWRARSRSSRTTTRARSSRSRARPPASAGSCATCSRSARGRSRSWTRCASARSPTSARSRYLLEQAVAGIGHYGNSIGVATVGGEMYFEAPVRAELPRQRDVRRADRDGQADQARPRPASATSSCCSARARGATGSAARPCWPAPSWATRTPTSARPCRSATRSRRRSCSSARSSCSTRGCWSRCRTSAPRA